MKKDVIVKSKVAARNGCDGRLIVKILITTGEFCAKTKRHQNSPENFYHLPTITAISWPPLWISHLFFPGVARRLLGPHDTLPCVLMRSQLCKFWNLESSQNNSLGFPTQNSKVLPFGVLVIFTQTDLSDKANKC